MFEFRFRKELSALRSLNAELLEKSVGKDEFIRSLLQQRDDAYKLSHEVREAAEEAVNLRAEVTKLKSQVESLNADVSIYKATARGALGAMMSWPPKAFTVNDKMTKVTVDFDDPHVTSSIISLLALLVFTGVNPTIVGTQGDDSHRYVLVLFITRDELTADVAKWRAKLTFTVVGDVLITSGDKRIATLARVQPKLS